MTKEEKAEALDKELDRLDGEYFERFGQCYPFGHTGGHADTVEEAIRKIRRCLETNTPAVKSPTDYKPDRLY
jgi:hypothetical protein